MEHNCHIVPIIKSTCILQAMSLIFFSVRVNGIAIIGFKVCPKKNFLAFPGTMSRFCRFIVSLS